MCENEASGHALKLHVRCHNCLKLYQQSVPVPVGEDVPHDAEELVESAFVRDLKFRCPKCEAVFGEIVAFKIIEQRRAA